MALSSQTKESGHEQIGQLVQKSDKLFERAAKGKLNVVAR
jgi:hypothetical protein